jgi:hypothetical protein
MLCPTLRHCWNWSGVWHWCCVPQLQISPVDQVMSHVLLASGLYGPRSLADVYFSTLTGNTIHTRDFQA